MNSPAETSPTTIYDAGENMSCAGQIFWQMGDDRPNGVTVYFRAGGATGMVTNTAFGTISDVDTTAMNESWTARMASTAANPTIGQGGNASYFVEADATFKTVPRAIKTVGI